MDTITITRLCKSETCPSQFPGTPEWRDLAFPSASTDSLRKYRLQKTNQEAALIFKGGLFHRYEVAGPSFTPDSKTLSLICGVSRSQNTQQVALQLSERLMIGRGHSGVEIREYCSNSTDFPCSILGSSVNTHFMPHTQLGPGELLSTREPGWTPRSRFEELQLCRCCSPGPHQGAKAGSGGMEMPSAMSLYKAVPM